MEMKLCPECGEEIRVAAVRCKHCGWLEPKPIEAVDAVGVVVIALFAVMLFVYLMFKFGDACF